MVTESQWNLSGDYFENCNCDVVCPCLVSTNARSRRIRRKAFATWRWLSISTKANTATYRLDGLNVAMIAHTPGPFGDGN